MLKKQISIILTAVLLCVSWGITTAAESAANDIYYSYTYDTDGKSVPSPELYEPFKIIGESMGEYGSLHNPTDIFAAEGKLYVLDSGNQRVVILGEDLSAEREITVDYKSGIEDARGIFVDEGGNIYLALYKQKRILICGQDGQVKKVLEQPRSDMIPSDFVYAPTKVLVNQYGYVCVVAEGSYHGIVLMNTDGEFEGFYASDRVKSSVLSAVTTFLKSFFTNKQKSKLQRALPTGYSSMTMGKDGFIYTTSSTTSDMTSAIKKLSPTGTNILKNNDSEKYGDRETAVIAAVESKTAFGDICVDKDGFISTLDLTGCKIFQYDDESHLLGVFGTRSNQYGGFSEPVAIETFGEYILVADQKRGQIVCFRLTEYGRMLHEAVKYYREGIYDDSKELWLNIKERNGNLQLAYNGLGKAAYGEKNYKRAMYYYKISNSKTDYNAAFKAYRNLCFQRYFPVIFVIAAAFLIFIWIALSVKIKKGRTAKESSLEKKYISPFYTMFHPIDGYEQLKQSQKGNIIYSFIILLCVLTVHILSLQYTGFLFNAKNAEDINMLFEIAQVVVLFAAWVLSNWSVSTLMDGEGFAREIWIVSSYALLPYVFTGVIEIVLSNIMTLDEAFFVSGLSVIGTLWCMVNMIVGLMKVHQYSFGKTLGSAFLTCLGIVFMLFIAFLVYSIVGQFMDFARNIASELQFRM